jgi:hypothetical protein
MRKLWIALIAAAFAAVSYGAAAADNQPYTAQPKVEKPGRAADDGKDTVKSGGATTKPGRAADEQKPGKDEQKPAKKKAKKKKDASQS